MNWIKKLWTLCTGRQEKSEEETPAVAEILFQYIVDEEGDYIASYADWEKGHEEQMAKLCSLFLSSALDSALAEAIYENDTKSAKEIADIIFKSSAEEINEDSIKPSQAFRNI